MGNCNFYFQNVKPIRLSQKRLSRFILKQLHDSTQKDFHISYLFTNDETLHKLNFQYLHHDTFTDIITFDLSDIKSNIKTADIYISIERVIDNAQKLNLHWKEELYRVIFHGALHLAGYKDKKTKDKTLMRQMENEWINAYEKFLV